MNLCKGSGTGDSWNNTICLVVDWTAT